MGAYSLDMRAMPIDMQAYCFNMRAFNSYMRQLVRACKIAKPTCEKFLSTCKASTQHMFTTPKHKKTVRTSQKVRTVFIFRYSVISFQTSHSPELSLGLWP